MGNSRKESFMNREVRVGLWSMGLIICAVIFSYAFHQFSWGSPKVITWQVLLSSSQGLSGGSPVRYAGVAVGTVKSVELENHQAKVKVETKVEAHIPKNADVSVAKDGILGTYYLKVSGGYGANLQNGDEIKNLSDDKWEAMTGKAKKLVKTLEETKSHVKEW